MKPRAFKTGGVSQCFHCGRQLVRVTGGFLFDIVVDPLGNEVRVHKQCVKQVIGDGYKPKPTAETRARADSAALVVARGMP